MHCTYICVCVCVCQLGHCVSREQCEKRDSLHPRRHHSWCVGLLHMMVRRVMTYPKREKEGGRTEAKSQNYYKVQCNPELVMSLRDKISGEYRADFLAGFPLNLELLKNILLY